MDLKVKAKKISAKRSINPNIIIVKNSIKKQNDSVSSVTRECSVVSQLSVKRDHNSRVVSWAVTGGDSPSSYTAETLTVYRVCETRSLRGVLVRDLSTSTYKRTVDYFYKVLGCDIWLLFTALLSARV